MTIFDRFTFEQRSYAIQQLITLTEVLKEANLRDALAERGQLIEIGGASIQDAQQNILDHCLTYFGSPYSHEARETE